MYKGGVVTKYSKYNTKYLPDSLGNIKFMR